VSWWYDGINHTKSITEPALARTTTAHYTNNYNIIIACNALHCRDDGILYYDIIITTRTCVHDVGCIHIPKMFVLF